MKMEKSYKIEDIKKRVSCGEIFYSCVGCGEYSIERGEVNKKGKIETSFFIYEVDYLNGEDVYHLGATVKAENEESALLEYVNNQEGDFYINF
jgi:uncharacterized OB-fold protein